VPQLISKRGGDPEKALRFLRALAGLVEMIGVDIYGEFEAEARERPEIRKTGRSWRPRWRWAVRSGLKTLISSGAAFLHGPRIVSRCFSGNDRSRNDYDHCANNSFGSGAGSPERITGAHSRKLAVRGFLNNCSCAWRNASARPFPALSSL
jgi:hypothetical protein